MKNIWEISYIERLSSSTGMERYNIDTEKHGYAITNTDSVFELERLLEKVVAGPQTSFLQLLKAIYLGHPIVDETT